jgi:SAM-dependent methyltransferase
MRGSLDHSSHAVLIREKRIAKARKISAILAHHGTTTAGAQVLDVGTGGGFIAEHFMRIGGVVTAVDRENQLPPDSKVNLRIVAGNVLPFDAGAFDIVISNHVIEHVGGRDSQLEHLYELRRVCRGVVYVATPNRWAFIEPHFKLPFLSWLPEGFRTPYVRLLGKPRYDVWPLTRHQFLELAGSAGLRTTDVTGTALRLMSNEMPRLAPLLAIAPLWLGNLPVIPTFIFLLR